MKTKPIGIFDSGLGGLTVVRELIRVLPREDIIYLGDTARVPYGTKSKETVTRFSIENVLFLLRHNVKLIVVACNTASSLALPFLVRNFHVPIIGVIGPGVKMGSHTTRTRRIGVIGTAATVQSGAYPAQIKKYDPTIRVLSQSCPLFVPFVEEGWLSGRLVTDVARTYLRPLCAGRVDTIILGCTHYPLLKPVIQRVVGRGVTLIDSARCLAAEVKELLEQKDLLRTGRVERGRHRYFVTDEPSRFGTLGSRFLGGKIGLVRKADISF